LISKQNPEISVILVNYNGKVFIEDCLDSLIRDPFYEQTEILVVDNGSKDESPELIREKYPVVNLLINTENRGFAWANNQGIQVSRGDYVLLLNTDTAVPPGALRELLSILKSDENIGAVGPLLYSNENQYQVSFGYKVDFLHELLKRSILNYIWKKRLRYLRRDIAVRWLSGACILIRKKSLEEVRFFDDNFFLYFEDIDLCYRLQQKKYKLILTPSVRVYHKGGGSSVAESLKNRLHYRRSQLYFYQKHNSRLSLFLLKIYLRIVFLFSYVKSRLAKDGSAARKKEFFKLLRPPEKESK
jgi:GT2 family glycosyltransferase